MVGSKSKELGVQTSFHRPYFGTQDGTLARGLVSRIGCNIVLSWVHYELVGTWCYVGGSSFSHILDSYFRVKSLGPNFCSQPIRSLSLGDSLDLDLMGC